MALFTHKRVINYDDYMTPYHVWNDIDIYIPKDKIIWESAYGDGKSKAILQSLGVKKIIHKPYDFFKKQPKRWDIQITNPPFNIKKEWFEQSKKYDKPFIILCPSSTLNTQYFRKFFKDKIQIIIPRKRINFIKYDREKNEIISQSNRCNFDTLYYCYKMNLPKDIIWL